MDAPAPASLFHAFQAAVARFGAAPAAKFCEEGVWVERDWNSIAADVKRVADGLLAWGLGPGERVAIMAPTSLSWVVVELALFAVEAIVVPIYPTSGAGDVEHLLNDAGVRLAFVADAALCGHVLDPWQRAPRLAHVVVMNNDSEGFEREDITSLASFVEEGQRQPRFDMEAPPRCQSSDLAFLMYTSGTTGRPKGAMISHGNQMASTCGIYEAELQKPGDVQLFFLPLAHCFAQMLLGNWFLVGGVLVFAQRIETVIDDMGATAPTFFAGVPRLYEKVYNKVVTDGSAAPGLKGFLFRKTIAALSASAATRARGRRFFSFWLLLGTWLVIPKIRQRLLARMGGKMEWMVSGGAPLAAPIMGLFEACGIPLYEGYGLTECMGAATANLGEGRRIGTVGKAVGAMKVRIADDGEVLMKGPSIMAGYWNQPEATRVALDAEGWLHTGDIGVMGDDGRLTITDRKKDIIVTANGKKVAPQNAENALKTCSLVSQVVVYGDRRPYLTALVTINDECSRATLRQNGVEHSELTFRSVSRHPLIRARIQQAFDLHNAHVGRFEMIRRFVVLDHDFTLEGGDMTATLKLRRDRVVKRYDGIIEAMYEAPSLLRRSFTILQALTSAPNRKGASDG